MKTTINITDSHGRVISLLVALACGIYSLMLGQDMNWDLQNYHLYNPYAFLNGRVGFDLAPAGLQTWFNPLLDILYFSAISVLSPKTVGFLIGFIQGLSFFLVYKITVKLLATHQQKHLYALLIALAAVLTVGFQAQIGTTLHDSLTALFPLTSLLMILTAIGLLSETNHRPAYRLLVIAGVITGIGVGLKLVVAIYALALCIALLVTPVNWTNRIKLCFIFGFAVLAGFIATGSYWMLETWRLFGNPLFPQFNNIFHGEMATFEPIRDVRFLPKTFFDKVFYPVIFTLNPQRAAELKYEQFSWLFAYFGILLLLVTRVVSYFRKPVKESKWSPEATYLLTFFCISFFIWVNVFGIYRYLIVIELLIPLLLFVIITNMVNFQYREWDALAFIALLTLINLPGAPSWWRADWGEQVYRIEPSVFESEPSPANVFLAGQPVAWIIPALGIPSRFIQIVMNFPISEAYWERAKILASERPGKNYVIFANDSEHVSKWAEHGLIKLGLTLDESTCDKITAYLGGNKFEYRYCETRKMETD